MQRLGGESQHPPGAELALFGEARGIIEECRWRAKEIDMTLQLSIDDRIVQGARKVAESMGTSIDQLVRDYLERLTSQQNVDDEIEELRRLSGQGDSRGWKFNRDELHERR
jgi:hypothetical protein